jgi:predicted CopG family antitoxin
MVIGNVRKRTLIFLFFLTFIISLDAKEYVSANVFIDIKGYESLEEVIKKIIKIKKEDRAFPLNKLAVKPIDVDKMHLTLHAFDIAVIDKLSNQQKEVLAEVIKSKLQQATEAEIQKILKHLNKKGEKAMSLPFQGLEVFNWFLVARFKLRGGEKGLFAQMLKNIDITFINLLQKSKRLNDTNIFPKFPITSIEWTYSDIKPHISLGKFQDNFLNDINPYAGTIVESPIKIPDFKISKAEVYPSIIWMEK